MVRFPRVKSLAFYRDGVGFPTEGIVGAEFERGAVAFFDLRPGLRLALWPRANIAWDANVPQSPRSPTECAIGHNVGSREDVDAVMAQAKRAGPGSPSPPERPSGAAMPVISRIQTVICGRSSGIRG